MNYDSLLIYNNQCFEATYNFRNSSFLGIYSADGVRSLYGETKVGDRLKGNNFSARVIGNTDT